MSAVQLAFSRVKVPWQDAQIISVHGRSLDRLTQALQARAAKLAVLTDPIHSPAAIARLLLELGLSQTYQMWICENLGGPNEQVQQVNLRGQIDLSAAPLNLVILLRRESELVSPRPEQTSPLLGLMDQSFCSFDDRPGLLTKREIRVLVLAELTLHPGQVIWDIGAGTGSVAIEIARLVPDAQIYAGKKKQPQDNA